MIELYHWEPNGRSLALLICLGEKGLDFKGRYVDMLALEQHRPAFCSVSPEGIVPVLVTESETLTDAGLALQFLCDRYPEPALAPSEPGDWYDLQAWTAALDGAMGLVDDVQLLGWNLAMLNSLSREDFEELSVGMAELPKKKQSGWAQVQTEAEAAEDQLTLARERVAELVCKLENALSDSDWLVGEAFSIADILGFAHAHSLPALLPDSVNETTAPRVIDWLSRISRRDAVRDAIARASRRYRQPAFAPPGA